MLFARQIRQWSASAIASALFVATLLTVGVGSAVVFGGGAAGTGGGGGGDAIGSLPGSWGGSGGDSAASRRSGGGTGAGAGAAIPQFALVGTEAAIRSTIRDAAGAGWVELRKLDTFGNVEAIFHGHVQVWLDRQAVERGLVHTQLEISPVFGTSVALVQLGGHTLSRSIEPAADLPLSVQSLATSGVLDQSTLTLTLTDAKHASAKLVMTATGTQILIEQAH